MESFIAVMIILGVLVILMINQNQNQDNDYLEENIKESQRHILNQIVSDDGLRDQILSNNFVEVNNLVEISIPYGYIYEVKLCDLGQICNQNTYLAGEVYAQEAIISANITSYDPKVLKLFFYRNITN